MKVSLLKFIFLACIIISLNACAQQSYVTIKNIRFDVEIADTPQKQQLGLMFRDTLEKSHGMLFIYDRSRYQAFWMKNTFIYLDILFFDDSLKLIKIHHNVPPCRTERCPNYYSSKPAKYTLEINAGLAKKYDFKVGDQLELYLDQTK